MLCLGMLLVAVRLSAQWTPAANAVKLPDSLVFATTATVTNAVLMWHPVHQRYYSARAGNVTFPLHTWLATGGPSVAQSTAGFDTRGMWYNPNTYQAERNGFATAGWATMDIDGALNATNTFTSIFTGALQPTTQAAGTYDPVTNTVLFYSAGTVQVRSRATGAVVSTFPLTGVPLVSIATDILIYTGQVGYEIGLLNVAAKQVLFFSRATGAYSGVSQLPATAVTSSSYRMGYANQRFWLFNAAAKTWNAYCIWNEGCPSITLPVELLNQEVECVGGRATVRWTTGAEQGTSHFIIERSNNAVDWIEVGRVSAAGDSQHMVDYRWTDDRVSMDPVIYYRLRQVDRDGGEEVFIILSLTDCSPMDTEVFVSPVPAEEVVNVVVNLPSGVQGPVLLELRDMAGRTVSQHRMDLVAGQGRAEIAIGPCVGTYLLCLLEHQGQVTQCRRVVRN